MRLDHLLYREYRLHENGQSKSTVWISLFERRFWYQRNYCLLQKLQLLNGSVVQLVRMSLWYSEGRRFEFFLTHHPSLLAQSRDSGFKRAKRNAAAESRQRRRRANQKMMRLESKTHFCVCDSRYSTDYPRNLLLCNILWIGFYVTVIAVMLREIAALQSNDGWTS